MTTTRRFIFIFSMLLTFLDQGKAQEVQNPAIINYIQTYQELAIREMLRTGVPASIKLAQGILETEAGQSDLVIRSNNHFGIKCKTSWTGEKVYHDDDARGECFRKYPEAEQSYIDHSDYLRSQPRYAFLFELDPVDYKGWAVGLKKAGYATNPKYAQILIKFIETYNLSEYTLFALGKKSPDSPAGFPNQPSTTSRQKGKTGNVSVQAQVPVMGENGAMGGLHESKEKPETSVRKKEFPSGEFAINDTRVIFANTGSSLLAIAEQYHIKLGWLLDFNDLPSGMEILDKEQLLFLQRKRKQSHNEYHIVEVGENLYDIAQLEALRLESLLHYNQLEKSMIPAPGEKLYLKHKAPSRPALAEANNPLETDEEQSVYVVSEIVKDTGKAKNVQAVQHKVLPTETLYMLARRYQVEMGKIKEWNSLQTEELKAGQDLIIYKNR